MAINTIIHPTDFSEHSQAALSFASHLAAALQAKLLIVHVAYPAEPPTVLMGGGMAGYPVSGTIDVPTPASTAPVKQRHLQNQLTGTKPTDTAVAYEHRLLEGDPASKIVELAEDLTASQIVMGSHGRQGISRVLVGSVAESVLRSAPCPVTVVKVRDKDEQA